MAYQQLIETMTHETYRNLLCAVETGKWSDGKRLTPAQLENTMAAVIAWGQTHLAEHERIGYIDKGHKSGENCDDPQEIPLAWKNPRTE
jgi:uncharacterized protein YeaC (DUF1315 family)